MPQSALVRFALVAGSAVTTLTVGAALAPAALAGDRAAPPGLSTRPAPDAAAAHAVLRTDAHGRKLR